MNGKVTIGLDAATKHTGFAVFYEQELIDYGIINCENKDWRERLFEQSKKLTKLFNKYKPSKVFVEDVPLNTQGGIKVAIMLGAVQGMIYGVGASKNIEMEFIQPSSWRANLGLFDGTKEGKHRDELKQKSVNKANELFNLDLVYKSPNSKFNQDDISDAILLCYSQVKSKYFGKKLDK